MDLNELALIITLNQTFVLISKLIKSIGVFRTL